MGHDQRFKEFLQVFLQDFLKLFPEVEKRLDFRNAEFLDKELFVDFPQGSSRAADVVAKLKTHDGEPELVLIHLEVQARPEPSFGARMFEYYSLLWSRYRLPWMDKLLRQGKEEGFQEGREEGREAGLLDGKRETLLHLMEQKFGPLSGAIRERIRSLDSQAELDRYLERILTAESLSEMEIV